MTGTSVHGLWFISRRCGRIGPHTDAILICRQLPPQPPPRRVPFFADPFDIDYNNNNNNNNNNVSLLQLQTNAAKDNPQHLPRTTVHYNRIHTKNTRSSAR